MADNSLRERIIEANKVLVESLTGIKTVTRTIPEYSQLQDFALTQLPVAAVVGRLPVPKGKPTGRRAGDVEQVRSRLRVDIFVYLESNVNADTAISSLLDDLWRVLWTDQTRGGLTLDTEVTMQEDSQRWAPFMAFRVAVFHHYIHDTGGI